MGLPRAIIAPLAALTRKTRLSPRLPTKAKPAVVGRRRKCTDVTGPHVAILERGRTRR